MTGNPFAAEPGNRVVAIFLDAPPPADAVDRREELADERMALGKREIYVALSRRAWADRSCGSGGRRRNRAQHEHRGQAGRAGEGDGMSKDRAIPHDFEGEELESVFIGRRDGQARPTVILIPTVMGVSDLEIGFGRQLVELGYNALRRRPVRQEIPRRPRDTMFGEMTRLRGDRAALRRRLLHVLELVARPRRGAGRPDRRRRLLLRRPVRARPRPQRRRHRRRGQLPRPVRSAGLPPEKIKRQGRRLPRLGRPDGPAGQGRGARAGADRGRLRLANPRLRPCRPRLHQPARERACRSTALPTTRWPPSGRGPASSTSSRNCSAEAD